MEARVSDSVLSEKNLEEGTTHLQAVIDAAFDAYYDMDLVADELKTSGHWSELLCLSPANLPGTIAEFHDRVHPEDRDRMRATALRARRDWTRSTRVWEDEYRLRRGDGSYVEVRDRCVALRDKEGRIVHWIGLLHDATLEHKADHAYREAAQLYMTLFDEALNPSFRIDADCRFLDVNRAGLAFMAMVRPRLVGATVAEIWGEKAAAEVAAALSRGGAARTLEFEVGGADNVKALTVTLIACRFRGESTCFALGTDLTEHRNLRRTLERSQESLQQQTAALEDANTALRVIIEQRNHDRSSLEQMIASDVQGSIMPMLDRLKSRLAGTPEAIYLDAVQRNLQELVRPFTQSFEVFTEANAPLTRKEREIATLIRAGKSSPEIAAALYLAPTTVAFHRKNLRRKFGLGRGDPSLTSFLASSMSRS